MKILLIVLALLGVSATPGKAISVVDEVNPFIGTTNFSVCHPGAVLPHALMSVVPFNVMGSDLNQYDKDKRWWSAPYEYHNKFFTGFAHVTLSGVGCPEMGTLLTTAASGPLDVDYHHYGTTYRNEQATPGYYSVELEKYGIATDPDLTMKELMWANHWSWVPTYHDEHGIMSWLTTQTLE